MTIYHAEGKDSKIFESKLDLDYNNFLTKKIDKCSQCGDIYYAGVKSPHACLHASNSQTPSPENIFHSPVKDLNTPSVSPPCSLWCPADRPSTQDEIYSIWRKNGFYKHPVQPDMPDRTGHAERKSPVSEVLVKQKQEKYDDKTSDKFSFSPYDNFF